MKKMTNAFQPLKQQRRNLLAAALLTFSIGALQAQQAETLAPQSDAAVLADTSGSLPATSGRILQRVDTFETLGARHEITLRGIQGRAGLPFSIPQSQIVEEATVQLRYSWSPALLPDISHVRVLVNGVVVETLPVPKEQAGQIVETDVKIDPILITDYNWLEMQLIGHYTRECEDPDHTSLWANIDNGSTLTLKSRQLDTKNDLAQLPAPFFDARDTRALTLPFVLPNQLTPETLRAAGIVSSWMGSLAGYRGASFPVLSDGLPATGNGIVVGISSELPDGIAPHVGESSGPNVSIVTNPNDPYGRILVISGRNQDELTTAAKALALRTPLQGSNARITSFNDGAKRKPYDAPKWVASDRPVHLGELVDDVTELNTVGYNPDVIRVGLQLPPDLFVWKTDGIPLTLKYRYTVPADFNQSKLNLSINEAYVSTFALNGMPDTKSAPLRWWDRMSKQRGEMPITQKLALPTGPFSANSQLRFQFWFERPVADECKITFPDVSAGVDQDSFIDLSKIPHYMAMPNLAAFINSGFPFTRMADLSETTVVMPDNPTDTDAHNLLEILGRIGDSTGYPTLRLNVIKASDVEKYADTDIFILGSVDNQPLYTKWEKHLPVGTEAKNRRFWMTDWLMRRMPGMLRPNPVRTDLPAAADLSVHPASGSVILMGFESPLKAKRSVVAVLADEPGDVGLLTKAWKDPALVKLFQGSVVLVEEGKITSLAGNQGYYVGKLPLMTALRWFFANSPILLAFVLLGFAVLVGLLARILLRWHTRRRLQNQA